MTRFVFTAATALSTLAGVATTPAAAEGWEYLSYGIGYINTDVLSLDADIVGLSLTGDYNSSQFAFSGEIVATHRSIGPFSQSDIDVELLAGYRVEPELMLLFGLEVYYSDTVSTQTDFSLGLEYERDAFTLGAYVDGDEDDLNQTVVYGAYRLSEATEVSLSLSDSGGGPGSTTYTLALDHERGPLDLSAVWSTVPDVDAGIVGLGATYDIGDRTRLLGSATYYELGSGISIRSYQVGMGYRVAQNVWVDASYGRTDSNSSSADTEAVTLQLRFERGNRVMTRDRIRETQDNATFLFGF